jgi:hypothetical protein
VKPEPPRRSMSSLPAPDSRARPSTAVVTTSTSLTPGPTSRLTPTPTATVPAASGHARPAVDLQRVVQVTPLERELEVGDPAGLRGQPGPERRVPEVEVDVEARAGEVPDDEPVRSSSWRSASTGHPGPTPSRSRFV